MLVRALKTHSLTAAKPESIMDVVDQYVTSLQEGDILVITSKIISICEGSVVAKRDGLTKESLVPDHAQYYIPASYNQYGFSMTITDHLLVASAGIDESNGDGYYILWPRDPFATARMIWIHLREKHMIKDLGVLIIDSRTTPMRWGVTSQCIAWCGIKPLRDYRGTPDIFGYKLRVTKMSVIDNLACAAAFEMGEGAESQPLVVIRGAAVEYQDHPPTTEDLQITQITMQEDLYGMFLKGAPWQKGKKV